MHNPVLGVGSRLATGPAVELVQTAFARELADQLALFKGMSLADLAHTVMLIEAGVIPSADGACMRELFRASTGHFCRSVCTYSTITLERSRSSR